jgi:hypothetical protein
VERTDTYAVDNYRVEILGGIAAQLIMKAALQGKEVHHSTPIIAYCDNLGVVHHGNCANRPLAEKQKQADALRTFKHLVATSAGRATMRHVYGHMDRILRSDQMSLHERLNCLVDILADEALLAAIQSNQFILTQFPFEQVRICIGHKKLTGSARWQLTRYWGEKTARSLFNVRGIVHTHSFDLIYWKGLDRVMQAFLEMFRVFVTKQVSHFCATNKMLSIIDGKNKELMP